jgi:hypothetical protein
VSAVGIVGDSRAHSGRSSLKWFAWPLASALQFTDGMQQEQVMTSSLIRVVALTLASLASVCASAGEPPLGRPLTQRRPGTVERAFKLGLARQTRLEREGKTMERRIGSLFHPYFDADQRLYREALTETQSLLDSLPAPVKAGVDVGLLKPTMKATWRGEREVMPTVRDLRRAFEGAKPMALVEQQKAKLEALRERAVGELDRAFIDGRKAFLARLDSAPPEKLYEAAQRLIHELDEQASGREIRAQKTGEGHSSSYSSFSSSGLFRSTSSSSSSSGSSTSSQLVISASHYSIRLANSDSASAGGLQPTDVDPVKARQLAEKVLKAGEIVRALARRGSPLGAAFAQWERESTVEFITPKAELNDYSRYSRELHLTTRQSTIQVARAGADLSKLGDESFLSKAFADQLAKELVERGAVKFGSGDDLL